MTTEILRPNSQGFETTLPWTSPSQIPADHWKNVDDVTPDDNSSHCSRGNAVDGWFRDLYNLPSPSGSGTINKITVYVRVYTGSSSPSQSGLKISCRTHSNTYDGSEVTPANAWTTYNYIWANNPNTGSPWTWAEIIALEIGMNLRRTHVSYGTKCTQVYVEIDYTLPVAAGHSHGYVTG